MLLPKIIAFYQSAKRNAQNRTKPIIPLPTRALFALLLLGTTAAVLLAAGTLPILAPENLLRVTRSQPTTSPSLLLNRLSTIRPLTARDTILLQEKFENKASRLLYYKYGPDVLTGCPFCNSQDPRTYLLYAAPAVALPHLWNAVLVGIATSGSITGPAGHQWRALATYTAVALAAVDFYSLAQWDHVAGNEKAKILSEVSFFFWTSRTYRYLALATLNLVLAALLYVSTTNRMFVVAPTLSERIDQLTGALGGVNMKVRSANVLKNTVARDGELRALDAAYWAHEGQVVQEAMESEEVVQSMRDAVENRRINLEEMDRMAEGFTQQVMAEGLQGI